MARLSETNRGPLVACYLQGKTQDEAAADLGWTVFTLRAGCLPPATCSASGSPAAGPRSFTALFAGAVFAGVGFAAPPPAALAVRTLATATGTVPASVAAFAVSGVSVSRRRSLWPWS